MRKSQCLSDREFPEFFKTHLTFDPSGFFRGVMGHLKKRRGLQNGAVNTKDTCARRRRKTFSKTRARFWLLLISSSQSNLAIYRSQWYISLMLICPGSWSKFAGYKWVNISLPTKHISQSQGVSRMARDGGISLAESGDGGQPEGPPGHDGADSGAGWQRDTGTDSVDNIGFITRVICPSLGRHGAASSKHDTDTEKREIVYFYSGYHRLSIYLFSSKTSFKYTKSKPYLNFAAPLLYSKMLNYRIDGSPFVYIIFQASSGRELDQNKGLPSIL